MLLLACVVPCVSACVKSSATPPVLLLRAMASLHKLRLGSRQILPPHPPVLLAAPGNGLLTFILKKLVNEKRPVGGRSGEGMPSSHASSLFYFSVFLSLCAISAGGAALLAVPVMAAFTATVLYSRVFQTRDHTVPQVVAGAAQGILVALLAYQQLAVRGLAFA